MNGSGTLIDIWKELEKIILSDINAPQKDMFLAESPSYKSSEMSTYCGVSIKTKKVQRDNCQGRKWRSNKSRNICIHVI